jgi:Helicase conserved C-terminal domain
VFNILYRLEPGKMASAGYEWGAAGLRAFSETYGVLEKVTTIEPADNTCSKARVSKRIKRKPGASPLMFGQHLMHLAAFVSLEDISSELPPYTEEVISVPMDEALSTAYKTLEEDVKAAIREHHGNHSVLNAGLNALLLYPDRPWGIGELYGYEYDPDAGRRERFTIACTPDLDQDCLRPKERRLIELVKAEVNAGRRCHVYAVYTQKRDVTRRLERILAQQGLRVAVLTADVPPEKREAWFNKRLQNRVQVTISHPKLIETGIDLLSHNCVIFYQTGYSLHTLRQASRRSWRIGQRKPVRVLNLHYEDTLQASCLRLMGKKLLVSLAMEGKFTTEGLQALDDGDDILTAMARELVTEGQVGDPADAVWRKLQEQHAESFPARTEQCSPALAPAADVVPVPVAEAQARPFLIFGVKPASAGLLERKAEPKPASPESQLPLFRSLLEPPSFHLRVRPALRDIGKALDIDGIHPVVHVGFENVVGPVHVLWPVFHVSLVDTNRPLPRERPAEIIKPFSESRAQHDIRGREHNVLRAARQRRREYPDVPQLPFLADVPRGHDGPAHGAGANLTENGQVPFDALVGIEAHPRFLHRPNQRSSSSCIPKALPTSRTVVPIVSLAGPAHTSKWAQQVKYDVVTGLIGGALGIRRSSALEMTSTNAAICGRAVNCSDTTDTWFWVQT